ncbi:hypothetical protein REPUB_Repub02eG0256100 [Reevesia pubescens]
MAIAAAISLSLPLQTRRFSLTIVAAPFPSTSSLQFDSLPSNFSLQNPGFRISAVSSMSIGTQEKISTTSFLDRKETGFLHFIKYHGLGNDFILVDNRDSNEPRITLEQAMCGNGVRCFARFIAELENLQGKHRHGLLFPQNFILECRLVCFFTVHTGAGLIVPEIQDNGKVKVDMGEPILKASDVPTKLPANKDQSVIKSDLNVDGMTWNVTCVSMGNPHCVTFGTKGSQNLNVDELNLAAIGPNFEHHEMFPARTNTEFVGVFSCSHLKMRVWERGAGEALACGTGACAVVVAAVPEGRARRSCTVDLPGGPLEIEWREEDNHVYTTGPAEVAFYGSVPM